MKELEMKKQLIKMATAKGDYKTARKLAHEILEDVEVPLGERAITKNQLIKIAIKEGDSETAKRLTGEILDDERVSVGEKEATIRKLVKTATQKGDYETAKEFVWKMLNDDKIPEKSKAMDKKQLIKIYIKEGDYEAAKKLAGEIIDDEKVSVGEKAIVKNQLINMAIAEEDYATGKELAQEILGTEGVSVYEKEATKRQLEQLLKAERKKMIVNLKLLKQSAIYKQYYKYTRENLYAGKIPVDDLKEMAEKNSRTIQGCLFVAEVYKYFKAEDLGIKWLRGYKRKNPNMPVSDRKAIAGAMELLNNKRPVAIGVLQEQWDDVYSRLQSKTALEGHSDDEDQR